MTMRIFETLGTHTPITEELEIQSETRLSEDLETVRNASGNVDQLVSAAEVDENGDALETHSESSSERHSGLLPVHLLELSLHITELVKGDIAQWLDAASKPQAIPTLSGLLAGKFQPRYSSCTRHLLDQSLNSAIQGAIASAFQHLSLQLNSRQARALLMESILKEVQDFLQALKNVSDLCVNKGWERPTDEQILAEARNTGYSHRAFDITGTWSPRQNLEEKATQLAAFFAPRFKEAISEAVAEKAREGNHNAFTILPPLMNVPVIKYKIDELMTEGCLTGLEQLTRQLSEKAFWRSSINALLDEGAKQLRDLHENTLRLRRLSEVDNDDLAALEECSEAKQLAKSCAKTSSMFFRYIPLLDNLQTLLNKIFFRPLRRLGEAWSEKVMADSMEMALRAQLEITPDDWIAHCIEHVMSAQTQTDTLDHPSSLAVEEPIKEHIYRVAKGGFRAFFFGATFGGAVQAVNWCITRVVRGSRWLDRKAQSIGIMRPLWLLGKGAVGAVVFAMSLLKRLKLVIAVKQFFISHSRVASGIFITPAARIVTGHVEKRLENLIKSPIREVFIQRLLDRLMRELHLGTTTDEV